MSGTTYFVDVLMAVKGDVNTQIDRASAGVERVSKKSESLGKELYGLGGKLATGFTGAVEAVGSQVATLGKIGLAAGIGAVTYGVVGLNKELETTTVSLASVLNAQGITSSVEDGMQRAAGWVQQMKRDAKALPGEFSDLLYIVQSAASSAFNAGMSPERFEKLAANTMAASKALGVTSDMAGRELAQLLEGRSGAHNVLGTRLGFHAGDLANKTGDQRAAMVEGALQKFEPAIAVFSRTFDAQSSTFVDNMKQFATTATGPLFKRITETLTEVNDWFDNNQYKVKLWSDVIGDYLVRAFDYGKSAVQEWGPIVFDFASRAFDRIVRVWQDAQPYVEAIGRTIKDFLSDPGSLDKIADILKLYAGVKVGGMALSLGQGGMGVYSALMGGGAAAAGAGGAAAAGGAGAAETAAAAEWAAALGEAGLSGMAGTAATAIGAAGATLTASIGAVFGGVAAAIGATAYEIYDANQRAVSVDAAGGGAYGRSAGAQSFVDNMVDQGVTAATDFREGVDKITTGGWGELDRQGYKAAEHLGLLSDPSAFAAIGMQNVSDAADRLTFVMDSLAAAGDYASIALINAAADAKHMQAQFQADATSAANDVLKGSGVAVAAAAITSLDKAAADKKKFDEKKKGVAGKGGTTNYVSITVSSNQSPGQIAREVMREFGQQNKYRTSSPAVRNFGAGRAVP